MDKLVALPVAGDSFLLRRGCRNILVDGGSSSRPLIKALSDPRVTVDYLDIVVCTHADKDHAGGLTDFLDRSSIQVGEFWLPGAWLDSLPTLLQSPQKVVDGLIAELEKFHVQEIRGQWDEESTKARLHARAAEERRGINTDFQHHRSMDEMVGRSTGEIGLEWLKLQATNRVLDADNAAEAAKVFIRGRKSIRYRAAKKALGWQLRSFWLGLIDTAERIRKIAVLAIRHTVPVRWFDFAEFSKTRHACGGVPEVLVPLNAVELRQLPDVTGCTLSYLARLTPINEECLVFMSPARGDLFDGLGVIFTGDSPLGEGPGYSTAWLSPFADQVHWVVATAPHHGSESNAVAYKHLENVVNVVLWVRSGGTSRHPGPTFRGLGWAQRVCTHCPHRNLKRCSVEVQLCVGRHLPFMYRVTGHDCSC